ncbi:nucleotide pyrophosphohydrolase [Photobacterium sp. BZF1]|uniref:MazG nucleotide pyrophosphohydrolase domain-containing protein n=1 Tax=Photobacterium sp. BZF1 TaxID=1904457 RepID=UPI001653D806|nr:MazG nucleotide pyrophosphohydrolase domain-containing protein [Photobacterium sp. BZF1]MBC7003276.1 nucleotide pyrophosphohydrolase [Photobacterium sp. BZF1]
MEKLETLLGLARRKADIDKTSTWSEGAKTYLSELKAEVDEVNEEIAKQRLCFLEDELGDVLWDYLNALVALEEEEGINIDNVLARACNKYHERISGIEKGESWQEIKFRQKQALEHDQTNYEQKKHG